MSVEEMIASLEDQKLDCVKRYESAIQSLRGLRDLPEPHEPAMHRKLTFEPIHIEGEPLSQTVIGGRGPQVSEEAAPIRPGSRFHPVPTSGMPASETILRDRG